MLLLLPTANKKKNPFTPMIQGRTTSPPSPPFSAVSLYYTIDVYESKKSTEGEPFPWNHLSIVCFLVYTHYWLFLHHQFCTTEKCLCFPYAHPNMTKHLLVICHWMGFIAFQNCFQIYPSKMTILVDLIHYKTIHELQNWNQVFGGLGKPFTLSIFVL